MSGEIPAAARRALLAWYDANRRDLPWRRTSDPYAIWVSEAMLQQTRVETVIPYYERFLARFPDIESLATADLDDVLGEWAGLGYYSRARNLRRAAQVVVEDHSGCLPDDIEGLRSLPGVGRYTAGAVASIAFDREEPIVDGNVARVIARLLDIGENIKNPDVERRLWKVAGELARGKRPGDLNQSIMELGATICTPRSPRCLACPLLRHCASYRDGDPASLPVKSKKAPPRRVEAVAALVLRRGKSLAVRRPPSGLLGGLWELPGDDLAEKEAPDAGIVRGLRERVGLEIAEPKKLGSIEHVFTHRLLRLHVYRSDGAPNGRTKLSGFDAYKWLSPASLEKLPQGAVTKKALALLAGSPK